MKNETAAITPLVNQAAAQRPVHRELLDFVASDTRGESQAHAYRLIVKAALRIEWLEEHIHWNEEQVGIARNQVQNQMLVIKGYQDLVAKLEKQLARKKRAK